MSLQILTLTLDSITAGDYLTWCREPDPPALDYGLRSISVDADPLGDTITAILDWNQPPPAAAPAAAAAGLPLLAGAQLHTLTAVDPRLTNPTPTKAGTDPTLNRLEAVVRTDADPVPV
jgi:hypothetical protein